MATSTSYVDGNERNLDARTAFFYIATVNTRGVSGRFTAFLDSPHGVTRPSTRAAL